MADTTDSDSDIENDVNTNADTSNDHHSNPSEASQVEQDDLADGAFNSEALLAPGDGGIRSDPLVLAPIMTIVSGIIG